MFTYEESQLRCPAKSTLDQYLDPSDIELREEDFPLDQPFRVVWYKKFGDPFQAKAVAEAYVTMARLLFFFAVIFGLTGLGGAFFPDKPAWPVIAVAIPGSLALFYSCVIANRKVAKFMRSYRVFCGHIATYASLLGIKQEDLIKFPETAVKGKVRSIQDQNALEAVKYSSRQQYEAAGKWREHMQTLLNLAKDLGNLPPEESLQPYFDWADQQVTGANKSQPAELTT